MYPLIFGSENRLDGNVEAEKKYKPCKNGENVEAMLTYT